METLKVHLFKGSFGPFLALLNEHEVKYQMHATRSGVPMASSETLEIIKVIGSATFWPSLAMVIVAFLSRNRSRKVVITTANNKVVQAEGMSQKELETVLEKAVSLMAVETKPESNGEGES
jgi:hypothetical protein